MSGIGSPTTKAAVRSEIAKQAEGLIDLSHRIHSHPELGFEEFQAVAWCTEVLTALGFEVNKDVCGMATAFSARFGRGELEIAICCEYDALPDVGHACGHNVIAAAGVGAAAGLIPVADDLGLTIRVLGTPAEESGGGKILLLEGGAFDGAHAAMMVHPYPIELTHMPCLAVVNVDVQFAGRAAHAAAYPERGINAADAITIAQVAIGLLRQHAKSGDLVHGIVTNGGSAPNVVPDQTAARYCIRSSNLTGLAEWEQRVRQCFEAGALATGCSVRVAHRHSPYSEFRVDAAMEALYRANIERLGRRTNEPVGVPAASTDMANVSLRIPAIHPTIAVDSSGAVNHQPEFAASCINESADRAVVDGATALAWTAVDLATDPAERARLISGACA